MKYILFDLDGTLLPMDQDKFIKAYLHELGLKALELGLEPDKFIRVIWRGMESMIANNGEKTNEARFWDCFLEHFPGKIEDYNLKFEEFYLNEFKKVAVSCGKSELSKEIVSILKQKGYGLILATNPIFPRVATLERIRWAGLNPTDFSLITTYEISSYTKPNIAYYKEILTKIGAKPTECLMIGNDVREDLVVKEIGMDVYLVTDDLINEEGQSIAEFSHGTRKELLGFVQQLPEKTK